LASFVGVVLGLLVVVGSAWGTVGHVSGGGFGDGSVFEGGPSGVGVGVSGDVFASDPGQVSGQRVERFDGSGGFLGSWSVDAGTLVLGSVAVDSAVGGGVYVMGVDPNTGVVSVVKYDEAGTVQDVLDGSGSSLSINFGALAVDPTDGTVWVTATDFTDPNAPSQVVAGFDRASGALVGSFGGASGSPDGGLACAPSGLAAQGGQVFVLDSCKGRVDRYSAAGVFGATVDDGSRGAPVAVASDPVLGEVYVAEQGTQGLQVTHFSAGGGGKVQTFGIAPVTMPNDGGALRGLAVGPDATVYVGDVNTNRVERFTAFEGPTVTTDPVADPESTSVVLAGTIDPGGVLASYYYEWGPDINYGQSTPDVDAGSGSGPSSAPQEVTGLDPNTTYHYRIIGSNSSGQILGEDQSVTTDPAAPVVGSSSVASAITSSGARVHGSIDPNHSATNFHVEYGTTTGYGSATADEPAGDSPADTPVQTALTGLTAGTLYHYRIVADNGTGGPQAGADGTFITAPAAVAGATAVTSQMATLTGVLNPHGVSTTYHFNYGPSPGLGLSTAEVSAGAGDGELAVSSPVAGLMAGRTYYVQLVATSADGTVRTGAQGTFETIAGPVAIGVGAIDVTTNSATLVGSTDTHGLSGSYRFEVESLDKAYTANSVEQPTPAVNGLQRVTAGFAGLPEGRGFLGRLVATAEGGATSYSSQFAFATAAPPPPPPPLPPTPAGYGCTAPVLKAYNARPKPGESITITGSDLGVGGSVTLGNTATTSTDWAANGLTVDIPDDAKGTLGLVINCGRVSNTIAITIAADNTLTITKKTVTGSSASIVVATKAPGAILATGTRIKSTSATLTNAGTKTIKIKLTTAGTRALAKTKSRRLKTTIRLRFTPIGAQPVTKTVTVTFTRKAKAGR
jgi:IPT/TIG domain-containing protein